MSVRLTFVRLSTGDLANDQSNADAGLVFHETVSPSHESFREPCNGARCIASVSGDEPARQTTADILAQPFVAGMEVM